MAISPRCSQYIMASHWQAWGIVGQMTQRKENISPGLGARGQSGPACCRMWVTWEKKACTDQEERLQTAKELQGNPCTTGQQQIEV